MFEFAERLYAEILPTPPPNRSAGLACAIGFVFGGIGLAIYLRNVVDLLLPLVVVLVAASTLSEFGWIAGAIVSAAHGYFRVQLATAVPPAAVRP